MNEPNGDGSGGLPITNTTAKFLANILIGKTREIPILTIRVNAKISIRNA